MQDSGHAGIIIFASFKMHYTKLIFNERYHPAFGPIFLYFKKRIKNGNVARRRCKIIAEKKAPMHSIHFKKNKNNLMTFFSGDSR
ncbi:MAG: hypothetical protein WCG94_08600 [Methanothrix sp.]